VDNSIREWFAKSLSAYALLAAANVGALAARFFEALRAAKAQPELHVFRSGMHGFSMTQRNTISDHWIEELYWWLESYGLTQP
jgi:acetyl esterase/lipase